MQTIVQYHEKKQHREAIEGAFVAACFALLTFLPAVLILAARFN